MARPRLYRPGEEPPQSARVTASRQALAGRGGRLVQAALEREELDALARLKQAHGLATDRDAIGFAVMQAARRAGGVEKG